MNIIFILVEPARDENVGAAARALKTMGFSLLRLVNPCDYLTERARVTAHASQDILENALVYPALSDAINGCDFVIGSAAKRRNVKDDYHRLEDIPGIIKNKDDSIATVAVVFGREESGLTNEELSLCHIVSTIPMQATYPSLNLGQAVMLYAYELSRLMLKETVQSSRKAPEGEFAAAMEKFGAILDDVGIEGDGQWGEKMRERFSLLGKDDIGLFLRFAQKYAYMRRDHNPKG